MALKEKVAYLKGLMKGMDIGEESNEAKLFSAVSDILNEMAEEVEKLQTTTRELTGRVDEIDDDLADVEEEVYGSEEPDEEDDEEDEWYEITCPACGETFRVDEETLMEGGITCPACDEPLIFDLDEDEAGHDEENDAGEEDDIPDARNAEGSEQE